MDSPVYEVCPDYCFLRNPKEYPNPQSEVRDPKIPSPKFIENVEEFAIVILPEIILKLTVKFEN